MSELILPKGYKNELLERNLHVLFQRYPHERTRLEALLSEPVDNRPVAIIEPPACPSKPPLRVILLAGIGSPKFLADLYNDRTVRSDCLQIFVIENNLDFLRFCFQYSDITQPISNSKFEWFLMHNEESLKPALFSILKREAVASIMYNSHLLETSVSQPTEVVEFYKRVHTIYNETAFHVMHNFGRIGDSLDGIRATLMNKQALLNYPGIGDLKDAYRNMPALILGAGPSLDKNLDIIKKHNDKFVVIAADAALKPLIKAGIRVDYCTSIERLNNYQRPFFEGLDRLETELVAFPVVLPSQFDLYPGNIRLVYRNYSYFAYFEKAWPKGILKCGGSTSHLALRLADYFGCRKIFMLGLDSAYEKHETENLYRSHCSGTGHENWGDFIPSEKFTSDRKHLPMMLGEANDGTDVGTNMTYYQWSKELTEELSEIGQRAQLFNCSKRGLKIEGVPYAELDQVAVNFDPSFEKVPHRKELTFSREFDHKTVVRNFEAWLETSKSTIVECDEVMKLGDNDPVLRVRFDGLVHLFHVKFAMESLFIAFVVQCCAKEFFELENKWWELDGRMEIDMKPKTAVIKARFELFRDVLSQLIAIFKEVGDGQQVYKFTDS